MPLCEYRYYSESLRKQTQTALLVPGANHGPGPFPALYLLHGLSDDHSIWMRRTSIERYVEELPLIVVMPDGGRGFYCDANEGFAYETAIALELATEVERVFPALPERKGRFLQGLSMGGYGAIKLALRYPDRYVSAVSHSGALWFGSREPNRDPEFRKEFLRITGPNPQGGPHDLFRLAEKVPPEQRPRLRIDCGTEDFLIESNREFTARLVEIGYAHEYAEFPGEHSWSYWDEHVREGIRFHLSGS